MGKLAERLVTPGLWFSQSLSLSLLNKNIHVASLAPHKTVEARFPKVCLKKTRFCYHAVADAQRAPALRGLVQRLGGGLTQTWLSIQTYIFIHIPKGP